MTSLLNTITSLVIILSITLLNGCESDSSNGYDRSNPSYQEAKMTVEERERLNPTSFLSAHGTYRKNLIAEWVVEGKIKSAATVVKYKDVVLKIRFYSKTKTLIGTENHTLYKYFPAGKKKDFKIKTRGYKGTKSVGIEVISASAAS